MDVVAALDHVALAENRNAVFIWSVEMCFMFVTQINVIFMRPLYEAVILCDCIIKVHLRKFCGIVIILSCNCFLKTLFVPVRNRLLLRTEISILRFLSIYLSILLRALTDILTYKISHLHKYLL